MIGPAVTMRAGASEAGATESVAADVDSAVDSAAARPARRVVHAILPQWASPPECASGGDRYNARVCAELAAAGWSVVQHPVVGGWPHPDGEARGALARTLEAIPDAAVVLADGIVASAAPDIAGPHATRLAVAVVVHLPLGEQFPSHRLAGAAALERRMLSAARSVITTSAWTRERLLARYHLDPAAVTAVPPGCDPAPPAAGSDGGGRLVCVAALSPHKGQDVLLTALAGLGERAWRCRLIGPLGRDPGFVARLRDQASGPALAGRIEFAGALDDVALDAAYAAADVLLAPSRAETYGMVVSEALARGVPVIAAGVGGIPEAMGRTADGHLPGIVVPPGDPAELARALRRWLDSADVRDDLRGRALQRRDTLQGWAAAGSAIRQVLADAAAPAGPPPQHPGACARGGEHQ